MRETPTPDKIKKALAAADDAVKHSRATRKALAGRRTPNRPHRLASARARCASAAEPLRSFIGMVAWHNLPTDTELKMKDAIADLRYERRQIDKMKT